MSAITFGLHRHNVTKLQAPSGRGMWVYAVTLLILLSSAAVPSPLYSVYQSEWHLSPFVLTVVFAVYVAGLLLTLLTAGSVSDFIGRKPVVLIALAGAIAAMLLFAWANSGAALIAARIVQGFAVGLATGALGAAMIDHQPTHRPGIAGVLNGVVPPVALTAGALGSGFLVQYVVAPETTVYVVTAALLVLAGLAVAFVPERVSRRRGALVSLIPSIAVPSESRRLFAGVVGGMVGSWALGGLFLAFAGSVLRTAYGITSPAGTGMTIAVFTAVGALTGLLGHKADARRMMLLGLVSLVLGSLGIIGTILLASFPLFIVAAAIGGVGFGAAFQGALRLLLATAPPAGRAGLLSSVYVASYLALGLPSVIAGIFVPIDGLVPVLTAYGAFVAVVAVIVLVLQRIMRRARVAELQADEVEAEALAAA